MSTESSTEQVQNSTTAPSSSTVKKVRAPRVKKEKSALATNSLQSDISTLSSNVNEPVKVQVTLSEADFERFKAFRISHNGAEQTAIVKKGSGAAKVKRPVNWEKLSATEVPRRRNIGKVTAGASAPYRQAKNDPQIYASLVEEALRLTQERASKHTDASKKPRKVSTWAVYQKRNPSLFDALRTKKSEEAVLSQGTVA